MVADLTINNIDNLIKDIISKLFLVKQVDINDPKVVAAIIKIASEMAKHSHKVDGLTTMDELVDYFGVTGDKIIYSLIEEMTPELIKETLEYYVDFNNIDVAKKSYYDNLDFYEFLYLMIGVRKNLRNENMQLS